MYKIVIFTLFFVSNFITNAQENLRYNLKNGDAFTILQEASQEIIQELPDATQVINNSLAGLLYFEVIAVTPETYTIDVSFKQFSMKMSSPTLGEMMSINTENASDDFEHRMFLGMLDKPMQMIMKPTGEIIEINNGDAIVNGMLESMGDLDEATKDLMKTQLEKEWKAEVLSESFEQMTFIYSDQLKNIGDTWENSYAGEGKIQAKNTWTYVSSNQNTKSLSAQSEIAMNLSTDAIQLRLTGEQSSLVLVMSKNGFIKKLSVKSKATGDATMTQSPETTIPTTINSLTTYTLQ